MMASEQERVKNLLVDTVTLLCKNSLQFERELCVEGLLGVKVDQRDVFFLHISEKYKAASNTSDEFKSVNELSTSKDVADEKSDQFGMGDVTSEGVAEKSDNGAGVKMERTISEVSVVEELELQNPGMVARSIPLIAGQRRVPRKASSPHRNLSAISTDISDSDFPSSSGAELSGTEDPQRTFDQFDPGKQRDYRMRLPSDSDTEPSSSKRPRLESTDRHTENATVSALGVQDPKVTPWPMIAGQLGLPTQPTPYLEAEGPCTIVNDISQPGCSTWTTPSHSNPAQQMDLLMAVVTVPGLPSINTLSAMPQAFTTTTPRMAPFALPAPTKVVTSSKHTEPPPRTPGTSSDKLCFCPICGTGFSQQGNMRRHIRTHTGEKPYGCPHCRATFAQSTHLKRHVRTHTEERPFKCVLCSSAFPRKNTLSTHMTTYHATPSPYIPALLSPPPQPDMPPPQPHMPPPPQLDMPPPTSSPLQALQLSEVKASGQSAGFGGSNATVPMSSS